MNHLKINTPGIVHEAVDGEVVIVNLDNGLYFSTDGMGAAVWARVANGESKTTIIEWATAAFGHQDIESDFSTYFDQLVEHQLVTPVAEAPAPQPLEEEVLSPTAYGRPELNVYSDMEDLLLLDPVHDVADEGWPSANAS